MKIPAEASPTPTSRFVRACLRQPVDRTPVWFLRQAGRYMPEYMAVRKHHSLLEICRTPDIAAEVTITAAERLGVDAAIIFADLLLPFTPMGLDFEFVAGEGPQVHIPIRTYDQVAALRTDRTDDLSYVARAIEKVAAHFNTAKSSGNTGLSSSRIGLSSNTELSSSNTGLSSGLQATEPPASNQGALAPASQLGIIGFCGAPFTLASYMIEGGSSRNYINTKKLMYASGAEGLQPTTSNQQPTTRAWPLLMEKLVTVLTAFAAQQVEAGADVIQIFDSWAGALSVSDYRQYCLAPTTQLIRQVQALGVPVIYFGVDTASLLPTMRETGADVLGLDWRIPLDQGWNAVGHTRAIQGNLDPITLFAPEAILKSRVDEILRAAAGRPGHIFNLGHGIVPTTPVENVINVVNWVKNFSL